MLEGDDTAADSEADTAPPGDDRGDELAPTTLIDRYRIERRLGSGGMGVVYAARDIHLGRAVAVKVVAPRIDLAAGHGRLEREAQAMAKLRHRNLAIVHDIGVSAERLFVVMELVDGGTLADWLVAAPRSWREIVRMFLQAARGLAAAHAAGVVHRDFKPQNVLVGDDGIARVSDFGVAGVVGEERAAVVGTPGYIAPEVLRHEAVDGRADQFSFCVALHAALYGRRRFPRSAVTGLGRRGLGRIIARGLADDPRERWPTMAALIAAIEGRLERRRRVRAIAAVILAASAAVAIAMATRPTPARVDAWSPVVIGRERRDSPLGMVVSRDGTTVASIAPGEAWIEPREGGGTRRRVGFPYPTGVTSCRLSRSGDALWCGFDRGGGFEVWALDVARDHAVRRLPPTPALAIPPASFFDVGLDGSLVFGAVGLSALRRLGASGDVEELAAAGPGEMITGAAWSPDGRRLAYRVRTADGARIDILTLRNRRKTTVSRRICKELEWISDDRLACAPRAFRNPIVIELWLPADGGRARERVRYDGPEYQQVSGLSASAAGVLLSTSPNDQHLALVGLDPPTPARRISAGTVSDLAPVGWTASGRMVFGASDRGHLRIMALAPDGTIAAVRIGPAAEVPLASFGDTIVFGRFAGGERTIPFFETPYGRKYPDGELHRRRPDGVTELLGPTRGFSALLCAGGRPPCLLAERAGLDVVAVDWDPDTGVRGRERARWLATSYAANGALSPDGRTLAQVRRVLERSQLSLLTLDAGARRPIDLPGTSLDFPCWRSDGALLAIRSAGGERGIVRVRDDDTLELLAAVPAADEPLTTAKELALDRDGSTAAVLMTDAMQTHWWIARSP